MGGDRSFTVAALSGFAFGGLFPMDGVCALLGFPGGELCFFLAFRLGLVRLEDTVI